MQLVGIVKINLVLNKEGLRSKMRNNKVIYLLTVEDIQRVAEQTLDRKLSDDEIESITDTIANKINWYDAIADSIDEKIV